MGEYGSDAAAQDPRAGVEEDGDAYEPPRVEALGTLSELTRGANDGHMDGLSAGSATF